MMLEATKLHLMNEEATCQKKSFHIPLILVQRYIINLRKQTIFAQMWDKKCRVGRKLDY